MPQGLQTSQLTLDPRQFKRLLKRAVIPPLLLLLAFAGVLGWQVSQLLEVHKWEGQSDRVIAQTHNLSALLMDMESGLRGYAVAPDAHLLGRYERGMKSLDSALAQVTQAVADNSEQRRRVEEMRPLLERWRTHAQHVMALLQRNQLDPTLIAGDGERAMDDLQAALSGIVSAETSLRDARVLEMRRATMTTLAVGGGLAVFLGLVLAAMARRQLVTVAESYREALTVARRQADEIQQRENLVRLVADTIPAVISYIDANHRYRFANLAYEQYRGIPPDQVRGEHVRDVIGPLAYERVRPQIELALRGERIAFDAMVTFPRTGEREVRAEYYPHRLPNGSVVGIVSVLTDVTERNRGQRELARSEERYRTFIQQSSEGIWRMELDEPIPLSASVEKQVDLLYRHAYLAECNDAMARMYGLDRAEQLVGARLGDLMIRSEPENVKYLRTFIHSGYRLGDDEVKETDHTGAERCFVYNLVGVVEGGNLVRAWATQRDVTDRRQAEEQRDALLASERAARAEAERAGRMKDEFLSMLSHELRTPLNAIMGWSQLLRREDVTAADLVQGLESIERNSRAQAQIIEDLLDMSRIIAGKVRLEVGKVELSEVVDNAMDTVRHAARSKGVTIGKRVEGNEPLVVMGDENRLQQVVWNLLNNAIKFTPGGGRVNVSLRRNDAVAELSVSDTGIGIRPEFLPQVFDRFRQADSSSTRSHGGLGLGLAIVRQMVEMHGGTVRAESDGEGRGATFRIELPLMPTLPGQPEPAAPADEERIAFAPTARDLHTSPASLAGLNVLVVDDEPDALELVRRMLAENQAIVTCATSATEALDLLERARVDVVVSDIGMPERDGYWLIEQIRTAEADKSFRTPAVALTAFAGPQDRLRALQAGYQIHVPKPVEPAELVAVVATAAGRRVTTT